MDPFSESQKAMAKLAPLKQKLPKKKSKKLQVILERLQSNLVTMSDAQIEIMNLRSFYRFKSILSIIKTIFTIICLATISAIGILYIYGILNLIFGTVK